MSEVRVLQPKPETAAAIDWLANNDLKGQTYVALVELGESTSRELSNELEQNVHPDAAQSARAYPKTFVKGGFADVFVEEGSGLNRKIYYYSAINETGALAVIGALQGWSEAYDYPLVTALSMTASNGIGSAPVNTIQILDGLERGLRLGEMGLPGYKPDQDGVVHPLNSRLKTLLDIDLVRGIDEPLGYKIMDPEYKGILPFRTLSDGRKGFYYTVRAAKEIDEDKEWTDGQLLDLARAHNFIDDASETDFISALKRAVSTSTPRYSPGVIEKRDFLPRKYIINKVYGDMVHDLVETVARVDQSPSFRRQARDFARDAYYVPEIAFRIAERGLKNSRYRKV